MFLFNDIVSAAEEHRGIQRQMSRKQNLHFGKQIWIREEISMDHVQVASWSSPTHAEGKEKKPSVRVAGNLMKSLTVRL